MIENRFVHPNAYVIDVYNQGMSGENRLGAAKILKLLNEFEQTELEIKLFITAVKQYFHYFTFLHLR